jgi:hypothetical protein
LRAISEIFPFTTATSASAEIFSVEMEIPREMLGKYAVISTSVGSTP